MYQEELLVSVNESGQEIWLIASPSLLLYASGPLGWLLQTDLLENLRKPSVNLSPGKQTLKVAEVAWGQLEPCTADEQKSSWSPVGYPSSPFPFLLP